VSATRTRLLQATLASVAELGFAATTTETIVGRA
jgi:AcrR family transcriptional regulator